MCEDGEGEGEGMSSNSSAALDLTLCDSSLSSSCLDRRVLPGRFFFLPFLVFSKLRNE